MAFISTMVLVACQDDFTEEDFLKLQNELAIDKEERDSAYLANMTQEQANSYIAALNEAGDLMAVNILVREEDAPVAGVTVSITSGDDENPPNGRTQAVVTATTDATGTAIFERVVIGQSVISISKSGYFSVSARVNFGTPESPIAITSSVNGVSRTTYIAPEKRFENFNLPMFSSSATEGSTAVIQGTFRIQNDLTNDPNAIDALPSGLTVSADIAQALMAQTVNPLTSSCGCITDYRFSGAAGSLGVAAIDPATGNYSMVVPAAAGGLTIGLIYPTIVGTQRIAVRRLNGQDIAPEFRNVPTRWVPGAAANAIPAIPGAKAVFTYNGAATPAPNGRGFNVTAFTPVARTLDGATISATGNSTFGLTTYRINSRGFGYSSSPAVAITGGGGTGATATSSLRGFVTSASISAGGTGYAASTFFDIEFTYTDANGTAIPYATIQDVQSSAGGVLPVGALTLPNAAGFKGNATPFTTGQAIQGFGVRVVNDGTSTVATATTQATLVSAQDIELNSVAITNVGTGFTSAPTITLSGGGSPSSQASVTVPAFRTYFDFTLPAGGATTPYKVLPSGFAFTYSGNSVDGATLENPAKVDLVNAIGNIASNNVNFIDNVMTDGTNIAALNSALSFRTETAWTSAPTLTVIDRTIQAAAANVNISTTTGEITSITDPTGDAGTDNTLLIPSSANTVNGSGYDGVSVEIQPTITGAPGTGAVYTLPTSTSVTSKVVTWSGASTKVSGGSGYLSNLNRTNSSVGYTVTANVSAQPGKVYQLNVNAGTGDKLEDVQN